MKIIKVKTDSKNYDIKVGHDLLGSTPLKKLVSQKNKNDELIKLANSEISNAAENIEEFKFMDGVNNLKKLMKKFPIKSGGDNWESKGHIVPKEALLQYEI